jgi:Uma2 family endonuclease
MAAPAFEHVFPWTEEEYFALGETADRVELFDGSLLVSPAPTVKHQHVSRLLANALDPAARDAGLEVYLAVNVRLRPGRVPIPDLVITQPVPPDTLVVEARLLRLICEITSTNAATDRVLKMHYYAVAGIPWYLLVDPDPLTLTLYRLDGDKYVEEASAGPGELLRLTAPVAATLDVDQLGR